MAFFSCDATAGRLGGRGCFSCLGCSNTALGWALNQRRHGGSPPLERNRCRAGPPASVTASSCVRLAAAAALPRYAVAASSLSLRLVARFPLVGCVCVGALACCCSRLAFVSRLGLVFEYFERFVGGVGVVVALSSVQL